MAKILIVEDDEIVVTYVSKLLLAMGHLVTVAHSATRARGVLETEPDIALILLDHHLGKESGLDFLTAFRQSDRGRTLPVIVCSGDTKAATVRSFLPLKIAGFIMKPFQADRFKAEIEQVLLAAEDRIATRPVSA